MEFASASLHCCLSGAPTRPPLEGAVAVRKPSWQIQQRQTHFSKPPDVRAGAGTPTKIPPFAGTPFGLCPLSAQKPLEPISISSLTIRRLCFGLRPRLVQRRSVFQCRGLPGGCLYRPTLGCDPTCAIHGFPRRFMQRDLRHC